jgi:hypothetical protein
MVITENLVAANASSSNVTVSSISGSISDLSISNNISSANFVNTGVVDSVAHTVTGSTESTSSGTGALVITGGVGVGANVNISGNLQVTTNSLVNGSLLVGGTGSADSSSILEVSSASKGFLPPVSGGISGTVAGLMFYNSSSNLINYYNGSSWRAISLN